MTDVDAAIGPEGAAQSLARPSLSMSTVLAGLGRVVDPCSIATGVPIDIIDMGLVRGIDIDRGHVTVTLQLTSPICWQVANILEAVESNMKLAGATEVTCVVDPASEWLPDMIAERSRARLRDIRPVPVTIARKGA